MIFGPDMPDFKSNKRRLQADQRTTSAFYPHLSIISSSLLKFVASVVWNHIFYPVSLLIDFIEWMKRVLNLIQVMLFAVV